MPPEPTQRQSSKGGRRGWWRAYFHDHPGASSRQADAVLSGMKVKVYCKECMVRNIEELQVSDAEEVSRNQRASPRTVESITAYLWTLDMQVEKTRGYLNCRTATLLVHLKHCAYQPRSVQEKAAKDSQKRNRRASNLHGSSSSGSPSHGGVDVPELFSAAHPFPPSFQHHSGPVGASPPSAAPAHHAVSSGFSWQTPGAGPSAPGPPYDASNPGARPPPLLTPLHMRSAGGWPQSPQGSPGPNAMMHELSPWATESPHLSSRPSSSSVSPATQSPWLPGDNLHAATPSLLPFGGHHARSGSRAGSRTLSRHSSHSRVRSGPYPPPVSPSPGTEWTPAKQSRLESLITRLTSSANFALSWVQNPVWLTICDEFLPSFKPPTRRTLTSRLLRDEVKHFRSQAQQQTAHAEATLQADGWTGINSHHLIAFMMNANREIHTVRVLDTSHERKTAPNFLRHIEETLRTIGQDWNMIVVAFTSDASGESRAARIALLEKYPWLIVLDCYAHQVNLVVGDYLGSGSGILAVADSAEELISWLRRRTLVLARIREVQTANGKSASAVIRPVATRWTSHYLAFKRLLELQPTLAAILASDRVAGGETTFMAGIRGSAAKAKARQMLALIEDGPFWHSLNRIKLHLEPFAIAANIAQAAHCRLDQVLLIFGFLYHRFSHLPSDINDDVSTSAILKSLEDRWAKSDQALFVAAVILNPVYRLAPFSALPEFVEMQLEDLLVQLWKRLFRAASDSEVPPELCDDIKLYFGKKGWFSNLDDYVNKKLERARIMNVPVDPLEIWDGLKVLDSGPRPLAMLARRILSVCANSASCERLFSIFGQLLTKPRNRMGSTTLAALAELKIHLRDEYSRSQGMKERLKRHCGKPQDETVPRGPAVDSSALAATTASGSDETANDVADTSRVPTQEGSPTATPPGELRAISDALTCARDEDVDVDSHRLSRQYTAANGRDRPFSRTLAELFNFSSPLWLARIEALASLGLDQELALYELLDLDASGESVADESDSRDEGDLSELDALTAEILHA